MKLISKPAQISAFSQKTIFREVLFEQVWQIIPNWKGKGKYNIQEYQALIRLFMVHISESWLEYKQKDSRSHKNEIVKIIVGNQQRLGFLMTYNSSSQIVQTKI